MKKLIKVEQRHIDRGIRDSETSCPVALALIDSGFHWPFVCGSIRVYDNYYGKIYGDCPRSVRRFVDNFDKNGCSAVKPFNFYLETDLINAKTN